MTRKDEIGSNSYSRRGWKDHWLRSDVLQGSHTMRSVKKMDPVGGDGDVVGGVEVPSGAVTREDVGGVIWRAGIDWEIRISRKFLGRTGLVTKE